MEPTLNIAGGDSSNDHLRRKFEEQLERLASARPFAKTRHQVAALDIARRVLLQPGGLRTLYALAGRFDACELFMGTDWADAETLLPSLVRATLESGDRTTVTIECLSQLRLLAIANGDIQSGQMSSEAARRFLTQVLALNLDLLFDYSDEVMRERLGTLQEGVKRQFHFLLDHIGFDDILNNLVDEIWRLLAQRPIQVTSIRAMVTQVAVAGARGDVGGLPHRRLPSPHGADRLVSALFGPTEASRDDPGLEAYVERLEKMDVVRLRQEAYGFARAMHDVGLVSDYHAVFVRWLLENSHEQLVPNALGLSSTGLDALRSYQSLVHRLIEEAIYPHTAQAVYGLALLLERGILYAAPIAPALWRQIALQPSAQNEAMLTSVFGSLVPPRVHLLAGVIAVLGQPLGISQGNNPTCQSARAISMWAYNDPDYFLHLLAHAARFNGIMLHFEGQPIFSADVDTDSPFVAPLDTDPVSTILVPHLDRIYREMGRRCIGRREDPHRWINPEFHGWWVGREFKIAVDVATGKLQDYSSFIEQFYRSYHPFFNGNQPIIHPQPAGIAITDSSARYIGWHAITLIRVALDQENEMRVYFFNPNNDSGQNWGNGVTVSARDHGERYGESSLPFAELASRLYIFHDDPVEELYESQVPAEEISRVTEMAISSWAAGRQPPVE